MNRSTGSILLLLVILIAGYRGQAQTAAEMMRQAEASIASSSRTDDIAILEELRTKYPTSPAILLTNQWLAGYYEGQGKVEEARATLIYALNLVPFAEEWEHIPDTFAEAFYMFSAKGDICVRLSQLYDNEGDTAHALYLLDLADSMYLPQTTDMQQRINYRAWLSLQYRKHYLRVGDTAAAIKRLTAFFMTGVPHAGTLTDSLRSLLLARNSKRNVKHIVDRAIAAVTADTVIENNTRTTYYSFTLFDVPVLREASSSRKRFQSRLRHDPYIRRLRG